MSDLFSQLIENQNLQGLVFQGLQGLFLELYLLIMTLFFCWKGLGSLSRMKGKIAESEEALDDLESWREKNPRFRASGRRRAVANAPSDSTLNTRTQEWLKLLWSGYMQNKPPVVDEMVVKEEEYLCRDDEKIRTASNSLIVLGLLGTFAGLWLVIRPIQGIIQNIRDSATITDPSAATQSMTDMLENIGQSFSGMEFAFVTSVFGIILMIFVNSRFSSLNKKRLEHIDKMESYCNVEIGPKFSLVVSAEDLKEAVQEAFRELADKHSEFMGGQEDYLKELADKHSGFMKDQADYLKTSLEAHFEKESAALEPFLETLNNTSDMLKKASDSSEKVSERWVNTLDNFSQRHERVADQLEEHIKNALEAHFKELTGSLGALLKTLNNACDSLNNGATDIRESGEDFVKHISNFTKLSEPLENIRAAVEKMVEDFDERIDALALTMGETYQVLQKLNPDEPTYKPVFDNIAAQLAAIHATGQEILKFYSVSGDRGKTGSDGKADPLSKSIRTTEHVPQDQVLVSLPYAQY